MQFLCDEMGLGAGPKVHPASILRSEHWKGRENELSGISGRYLKPLFAKVTPSKSNHDKSSIQKTNTAASISPAA